MLGRDQKERARVESPPRKRSLTGRVIRIIGIVLLILLGIELVATAGADTVVAVQKLIRQVFGSEPREQDRSLPEKTD
jgi:hypothetical protein